MKTKWSTTAFMALIGLFFVLLGWRLFYLQYCRAEFYLDRSNRSQYATVTETARRGIITDARGRTLAASNPVLTLMAEPRVFSDPEKLKDIAVQLQEIINIPAHDICRIINDKEAPGYNPGYVRIKESISPDEHEEIRALKLKGIGVESNWRRYYPMERLTSHLVGIVGHDQKGLMGIEQKYDPLLMGSEGSNVYLVDAHRRPIGAKAAGSKLAHNGMGLVLTIDATIQQFARTALMKQYTKFQAESAIAVVMDPWTGEILALVSLPDFDPRSFTDLTREEFENVQKNRALSDPYEPGSIFKPIVTAVGLDAGAIGYNEMIYCENGYYAKYKIGEFLNHPYGNLSVSEIIAKSSNVGMAKIGLKLGKKSLYKGVKLFGFGDKTGIDLPGEDAGLFMHYRNWDGLTVTRVPFGHAISVTAIQIIRGYCILANGGSSITPHIVRAVIDDSGNVKDIKHPMNLVGHVIKPEVADWIVRTAMVECVNEGTGKSAQIEGVQSFGKTGTANIARPNGGGYDKQNYIASFVGGAPAEKPEVIVLVSIRKPNRALGMGYSGGKVAAPVFKEIMENILQYRHQLPDVEKKTVVMKFIE